MIFGSVCSGIEAASCAWEPLGWRAKFFAEIAPFPSRVLAHRFPFVPNHGDFTQITAEQAGGIDLLVGGTPCQSFSIAGLRGGLADSRGNLALEFFRLADRARPRWIVWENVPGVLSSNGGRDFGSILGALGELGYGFAYRVLDAQFFGVPQRRRRVFVVGCLGDWPAPAAVLFEPPRLRWDSAESTRARRGSAGGAAVGTLQSGSRGGGWRVGAEDARDGHLIAGTVCASGKAAGSLTQQDFEAGCFALDRANDGITHTLRAEGFDASEDGTGRETPLAVSVAENQRGEVVTAGVTQALSRGGGKPGQGYPAVMVRDGGGFDAADHIAFHHKQDPISGDVSPCLNRATDGMGVSDGLAVRRLTPMECERLQGFPDGWTAIPGAADGPRYRAIGNSMAVPVMHWIGRRIDFVDRLLAKESA